jgi:hypothetical protein
MTIGYADLEFGLIWDDDQKSFDVSLRFTGPDNVDRLLHPKGSVRVDVAALARLANDQDAYEHLLTESVFELEEVRRFFADTMAVAGRAPVHFRLHIDGPVAFHSIRWESLRDPATQIPIATSRNVLFSRYLSGGDWRPVVDIPNRDLQALIVIAGPNNLHEYQPQGRMLAPVNVLDELQHARQALAPFHPIALAGPGEATLANTINKLEEGFDILYLVGHGVQTDDVPLLFLENPDGTADPVDARRLEEHIRHLPRRPIVALLNSCQSAGAGDQRHSEDGGALAALGPRLAAAGIPAVIAMQGNITIATASRFGPAFFAALAQESVVDHAMASAREAVRDRPDWWVPVLFSRLRSGRIYYEPQFTERAEATWQILGTMMETGNFTPVLGPGLADGILGSREEIARRWARRWQMPIALHVQSDLAQVAQYLRVSHNPAMVPGELQKYIRTEMRERKTNARGDDPFADLPEDMIDHDNPESTIVEVGRRLRSVDAADPFRVVAAMPVKVFITTGWTGLLQAALESANSGKKPQTLCFPWTRRVSWGAWDDPAQIEPPTVSRPWVYHLFGRLEDPRSLVLTEDDYFDWLSAWIATKDIKQIVPPAVKGALTASSLLFLGYRLDDWDFRVVFQSIKSFGLKDRFNDHVGVQLRPESQMIEREAAQRYLESYFGNDKVNIFWSDTRTFLDKLRERTGLRP